MCCFDSASATDFRVAYIWGDLACMPHCLCIGDCTGTLLRTVRENARLSSFRKFVVSALLFTFIPKYTHCARLCPDFPFPRKYTTLIEAHLVGNEFLLY